MLCAAPWTRVARAAARPTSPRPRAALVLLDACANTPATKHTLNELPEATDPIQLSIFVSLQKVNSLSRLTHLVRTS